MSIQNFILGLQIVFHLLDNYLASKIAKKSIKTNRNEERIKVIKLVQN